MKVFIFTLALLTALATSANEVECTNQSIYWEEDSLYLNLEKMTGRYFDNDTNTKLECYHSEIELEKGYIYCHESGDKTNLRTRIKPNGNAVVIYSADQWIDFICEL